MLKKIKENNELKRVEVEVVTKFMKDEVESASNNDVHDLVVDTDDDEQNRIIGFR